MEQSAESVSASASKINALGTRTKAFATKLAQLETTTSEEIPALKTEVSHPMTTSLEAWERVGGLLEQRGGWTFCMRCIF